MTQEQRISAARNIDALYFSPYNKIDAILDIIAAHDTGPDLVELMENGYRIYSIFDGMWAWVLKGTQIDMIKNSNLSLSEAIAAAWEHFSKSKGAKP